MPTYHFTLFNGAERIDDLGGVDLADNSEATEFGERVIRELLDKNPEQHALWVMGIMQGKRAIAILPLVLPET